MFLQTLGAGAVGASSAGCAGRFDDRDLSNTVTIGYPSPALPVYNFALFPGIHDELSKVGAKLEMKQFKGYTPMVSALVTGEISAGVLSLTSILRARAQDFPVVAPLGYTREYAFALVTAPEIERWADLRDRTIALHSPLSVSTVTGRTMVNERLGAVDAVDYEYIVGTPNRLAAIESGEVDAAVVFVSGALQAEREGTARVLGYPWQFDRLADQTTAALVTPGEAVEKRRESVQRFVDAALAAYGRLYETDPATVAESALATDAFASFPQSVWEEAFREVRQERIWPRDGGLNRAAIQRAQDVLVETDMIDSEKRLPPETFVAEGFR